MEILIIFIEGIVSFLSPCVLPMLPLYVSYFAGQDKDLKKTILNSFGFVLGFTTIFVLLGIFASTLGKLITANSRFITIIFGIVIIIFGMHYMGILDIKILNRSKGMQNKKEKLSFFSAILFGMMFSLCWTPCVGVFLSSALMMSATSENLLKGGLMLFIYSIGLGIPFILTSIFLERLKNTMNQIQKHYSLINKIAGLILIFSGIILIYNNRITTKPDTVIQENMLENLEEEEKRDIIEIKNAKQFEQEVINESGIVFVDFYAIWCMPCKTMESTIEEIAKEYEDVKFVKIDIDKNEELAVKYNIMSIPTMMVIKNGEVTKTFIGVTNKENIIKEF